MTVFFNGQQLFEVEDGSFTEPGKVGVDESRQRDVLRRFSL